MSVKWEATMMRCWNARAILWIVPVTLPGLLACVSCDCEKSKPEPEPEPPPEPEPTYSSGGCFDFDCGFPYADGEEWSDLRDQDFHDDIELLTDEAEIDTIDDDAPREACNGVDDDGNGIVDDIDGAIRCGDACCNGDESKLTCPGDCECEAPSTPALLAPRNGDSIRSRMPQFEWRLSSGNCGETFYDLDVDDSCEIASFGDCLFPEPEVHERGIESTTFTVETELPIPDVPPFVKRYYWRVRSCYFSTLCSPWSSVRYVDIGRSERDLNGDGMGDIAVGVEEACGTDPGRGKVFVFYVMEGGIADSPSLVLSDTENEGSNFGVDVSTSGDLNGDGYSDLVVGADSRDGEARDEGACMIYEGSETGLVADVATVLQNPDPRTWSRFGSSLASAGDLNGDGFSDLVVGARTMDGVARDEGLVYVYYGSASGLPETPDAVLFSVDHEAGGQFGLALSTDGDLNGDGIGDLVVGAPFQGGDIEEKGNVHVYFGSPGGVLQPPSLILENPVDSSGHFGSSISSGGDLNSDGYDDLIIGAERGEGSAAGEGAVIAYYGGADGLSGSEFFLVKNPDPGIAQAMGSSVGFIGDVNVDGLEDWAAGAPGLTGEMGRLFVFSGNEIEFGAAPDVTVTGPVQWFGYDIMGLGDVNHDGSSDLVVAGYLESGLKAAYVYYGIDYYFTLNLP